jgi:hypothetical protein
MNDPSLNFKVISIGAICVNRILWQNGGFQMLLKVFVSHVIAYFSYISLSSNDNDIKIGLRLIRKGATQARPKSELKEYAFLLFM